MLRKICQFYQVDCTTSEQIAELLNDILQLHIRSDDDYLYWDKITHNKMQWVYNLTYKFNKKLYEIELEKLRSWQYFKK